MFTKARLVARGFEDVGLDNHKTDSPTISKESLRIVISMIAINGWQCRSMDVETAFLQGTPVTRDIFVKPPKEANTDALWKLNVCVYGLNEASRHWYERASNELIAAGAKKSKFDEALYYYHSRGKSHGLVGLHVDDFMYGGTKFHDEQIIDTFRDKIVIGNEEVTPFKYIGAHVQQDKHEIFVDQQQYLNDMEGCEVDLQDRQRTLDHDEHHLFRSLVGQLNWLATQSRPDLSFDVCRLSTKLQAPIVQDVIDANKTLKKANSVKLQLRYKQLKRPLRLLAFCDASYANLPGGASQGGYIVFLTDGDNNCSPLAWRSRKLRRVCRSTLTAETLSLVDTIDICVWLKHIIEEIDNNELLPTIIRTDNKDLLDAAESTKAVEEKRLRVEIGVIRESIRNKDFVLQWVKGSKQIADSLTKQGANTSTLLQVLMDGSLQAILGS